MCAILDNSARGEVFRNAPTERGLIFYNWLNSGKGRLVIGGTKLRAELAGNRWQPGGESAGNRPQPGSANFRKWLPTAIRLGRVTEWDDREIDDATRDLKKDKVCQSNDPHVIALARASGARLLYTNDDDLETDFKNARLISKPRGKIYPNEGWQEFLNDRRNRRLCASATA